MLLIKLAEDVDSTSSVKLLPMRVVSIVIEFFLFLLTLASLLFRKMLEACYETSKMLTSTYETGMQMLDRQGFEVSDDPVWILGRQYDTKTSKQL